MDLKSNSSQIGFFFTLLIFILSTFSFQSAEAQSPRVKSMIQKDTEASRTALQEFRRDVKGAKLLLENAKGVLVIPEVYQGYIANPGGPIPFDNIAPFFWTLTSGRGVLFADEKYLDSYSLEETQMRAGWMLWPSWYAKKPFDLIILFMDQEAIRGLQTRSKSKIGRDIKGPRLTIKPGGQIDIYRKDTVVIAFNRKKWFYENSLSGMNISKTDWLPF